MKKFILMSIAILFTCSLSYGTIYDFEDGTLQGWGEEEYQDRQDNGYLENSTAQAYSGTHSLGFTVTNTRSSYDYAPVRDLPCLEGIVVTSSFYGYFVGDGSGIRLWGAWLDASHDYLASANGNSTYISGAAWEKREHITAAAPAGTAFFRLQARVYATGNDDYGYIDYAECNLVPEPATIGIIGLSLLFFRRK